MLDGEMICSSCNTVYSPTPEQLGKVETLAGYCDKCGTEPRLKRFAVAFNEGAIAGVLAIELILILVILGRWYAGVIPPVAVAVVCFSVYSFSNRSEPVRYEDKEHRNSETRGQRVMGWILGFTVGLGAMLGFISMQ